uniref:Sas10 domain-containing protein n=2 Tax=Macrostomum lignano TaxID=282301 RepID=A0A1I8GF36_9PLAT
FFQADSSDSERDFEADQDKILLDELSRHAEASRKSRVKQPAAELLPVGLDSDNSADDDDEMVGQYRDILKRARLQKFRKEVAEDLVDDDEADKEEDSEEQLANRQWSTSRRYRYAAGDSDGEEEDDDIEGGEDASTARLMREERERLRRRLLGVGLPSDLPSSVSSTSATAAASTALSSKESLKKRPQQQQQLVRLATELPAYERPPPGVSLEQHLLLSDSNRWPDMRRAYEQKTRLENRLKPLVGLAESELTDEQAVLKWHYILLCAYLRMRADPTVSAGLHRHPIRRLLRQAEDATRNLVDISSNPSSTTSSSVNKKSSSKKSGKIKLEAAVEEEEEEAVDDKTSQQQQQQHRPIYWEMQKNLPVRLHKRRPRGGKKAKPGDSNPRVKLRDKFRKAMIKRRSQVPEVRPEVNRYSGEKSGIRAGLVKSQKFK